MNTSIINSLIQQHKTTAMNPVITRGYSTLAMSQENVLESIATYFKDLNSQSHPDLEFMGVSLATPREHAQRRANAFKELKIPWDNSTTYTVRVDHKLRGRQLRKPIYIQIPYLRPGNWSNFNGSDYYFHPLLVAKGFSPEKNNSLFTWIGKLNITFRGLRWQYMCLTGEGGQGGMRDHMFFHARLHMQSAEVMKAAQRKDERRIHIDTNPPIVTYLFCNHGVTKTFKDYFNADIIPTMEDVQTLEDKYDMSKYDICLSYGNNPGVMGTLRRSRNTRSAQGPLPSLKLLIPKEQHTPTVAGAIASLIWLADLFGDELINVENIDDTYFWLGILGDIIFNKPSRDVNITDAERHIKDSIELLYDETTAREFRMDDFDFKDIYDVFAYVCCNGADIISSHNPRSMAGKRLSVVRYALRNLITAVNRIGYRLKQETIDGRQLTEDRVISIFDSIKPNMLISGKDTSIPTQNGEVEAAQSSSDNMYHKITAKICPQEKNDKPTNNKTTSKGEIDSERNLVHASVPVYCRSFYQPKPAPTGRDQINPGLEVDPHTGELYPPQDALEREAYCQAQLDADPILLEVDDDDGLLDNEIETIQD